MLIDPPISFDRVQQTAEKAPVSCFTGAAAPAHFQIMDMYLLFKIDANKVERADVPHLIG
jgi:hypothetical protein